MNIPTNKEETDSILFELLEGNLSKEEELFWYDYALQNADFAKQLALFRKTYMKEDLLLFPDHSKMLLQKTKESLFKKPLFLFSAAIIGISGIVAGIFYYSKLQTNQKTESTNSITTVEKENKKETKQYVDTPKVRTSSSVPVDVRKTEVVVNTTTKTKKTAQDTLVEERPNPAQVPAPLLVDTIQLPKEEVLHVEEKKAVENPEQSKTPSIVETDQQKKPKNLPKLKIKPSRKTKTTDFNY